MLNEIADKINSLRRQKKITLKELSEKSGLSISFLSQIENGSCSLAITSLKKIADALEAPITTFFTSEENRNYHVSLSDQKVFSLEGSEAEYIRLSGAFSERNLEALLVTIRPNGSTGREYTHAGEEFVYVIQGLVLVDVDGKRFMVKAGESIHYPSTLPHYWENPLNEAVKLLTVVTPVIF